MCHLHENKSCKNLCIIGGLEFFVLPIRSPKGCIALQHLCWFGLGQVDFLQSSCSGAVFLTCDQNSVDNREMFLVLLSRVKAFLLLSPPRRLGGGEKELGRDRARTAHLKLIKNIP